MVNIKILRGTTAQNDAYTGPAGTVTIDTTLNTLRIHDGTTQGGYVVANRQEIIDLIDQLDVDDIDGLNSVLNEKSDRLVSWGSAISSNATVNDNWLDTVFSVNTSGGNVTISIPNNTTDPLPIGFCFGLFKGNSTNKVIIQGATSVILQAPGIPNKTGTGQSLYLNAQSSMVSITKRQANTWSVVGAVIEET